MQKNVFIIHGWQGNPSGDWFPWLKKELETRNFRVQVPAMPNATHPTLQDWLSRLQKTVGQPDENTYLVGHSLGVIAVLRYLETLGSNQRVGGVILAAGFSETTGHKEFETFFQTPLDYKKIKNSVKKIIAIHSDNDPYVPLKNGELLRDKLGAELIVVKDASHLNAEGGFTQLPVVLEKLLEISQFSPTQIL